MCSGLAFFIESGERVVEQHSQRYEVGDLGAFAEVLVQHGFGQVLSGTVATFEHMDGQASHQCRENLIKFFEVLESVEDQSFLSLLPGDALISIQLFTEQSEVASLEHDLVAEGEDAVHLPLRAAGSNPVGLQHDVLQVLHHGLNQRRQSFTLQRLQEGLVQVFRGVTMAWVHALMTKCLEEHEQTIFKRVALEPFK